MMLLTDELFSDEADVGELLQTVTLSRYLNLRAPPVYRDEFDLARLFEMRSIDFKQSTRTTKAGFVWLLNRIYLHPVFHNNSFRPQLPVPHQLAIALERLGSNGNGASVGRCARNLNVARGTVIKVTRRVIEAITSLGPHFMTGWPGSCGDSMVYKRMALHTNASQFFDSGQYLIGDAAYSLTMTTIPPYKVPAANLPENVEFNYCLAKSRVRNEHAIGVLKARWSSLKEMRLHLYRPTDMQAYIHWIYACIILHNMLASLDDTWRDLTSSDAHEQETIEEESEESSGEEDIPTVASERFRAKIKKKCLKHHHDLGTLPI
ncbi:uncharacterized protein PGTG_09184 [Puccinia graminis f. sp. tritici CRL 75-36-700-3]|uniref:DDE Tnp4 domain-containing protein n=1 Tax=Puccinia graminis f. sp. tritici (strain CRL 75-36-700-3 / race SCCL) TaxID=418459 RepID=E3KFU6_PUCGT|nr:uncharacterized protein PGTG_09184 [Puccinia graminis f. sp. tritici CRL 75-36-700-3]EFP83231.2 hypothetical protein PGTG_09184 [Puccinia graminis f. sp. tritici CRL 75-36-700-3]